MILSDLTELIISCVNLLGAQWLERQNVCISQEDWDSNPLQLFQNLGNFIPSPLPVSIE